jgi:hypothetical protein
MLPTLDPREKPPDTRTEVPANTLVDVSALTPTKHTAANAQAKGDGVRPAAARGAVKTCMVIAIPI